MEMTEQIPDYEYEDVEVADVKEIRNE